MTHRLSLILAVVWRGKGAVCSQAELSQALVQPICVQSHLKDIHTKDLLSTVTPCWWGGRSTTYVSCKSTLLLEREKDKRGTFWYGSEGTWEVGHHRKGSFTLQGIVGLQQEVSL